MNTNPFYRKFGFELEFSTYMNAVQEMVKKIIPKIYGRNKLVPDAASWECNKKYNKWELKSDGSTECELTTPISTIKDFKKIEQVLIELKERNISVTRKDSVHVHMQANKISKHQLIAAWLQIENIIIKCFPRHRRNNTYCQKLIHWRKYKKLSDFFIKAEDEAKDHHSIFSLCYYDDRKTVEFRVMEGNINIQDIKPWVKFCMLFLNYAKTIDPIEIICKKKNRINNIKELIELLKIYDEEIIEFLKRRKKKWK